MQKCSPTNLDRRRLFWTTQPGACGTDTSCGSDCGRPGLSYTEEDTFCYGEPGGCIPANVDPACASLYSNTTRTMINTNWVRGIVINMLMTDGRSADTECGYRPGTQGGHWSSSYIDNGPTDIGTLVRTVSATGTIQENVSLVSAYAQATLERLVARGVAHSVAVVGTYIGRGVMILDVEIFGTREGDVRVGLSAARLENSWVWS